MTAKFFSRRSVEYDQGVGRASHISSAGMAGEVQSLVRKGFVLACPAQLKKDMSILLVLIRLIPFTSDVGTCVSPSYFLFCLQAACTTSGLGEQ